MRIRIKFSQYLEQRRQNKKIDTILNTAGYIPESLIRFYHEKYGDTLGWIAAYPPTLSVKKTCYNMFISDVVAQNRNLDTITSEEVRRLLSN